MPRSVEETNTYRQLVEVFGAVLRIDDKEICEEAGFGLKDDGSTSDRWRTFKRRPKEKREARLTDEEVHNLNGLFARRFDERFYNYLLSNHPDICMEIYGRFGHEPQTDNGMPTNRHMRRRQGQFMRELRQLVGEDLVHGMLEGLIGQYISYRHETDGSLILSHVELLEFVGDRESIESVSRRLENDVELSFRGLVTASQNAIQMIGIPIPGKDFWMAQLQKTGGRRRLDLAGTLALVSDVTRRPFAPPVYFARLQGDPGKDFFKELAGFTGETAGGLDDLLADKVSWERIKDVLKEQGLHSRVDEG